MPLPVHPALAAWLHNLSPFLVQFSSSFGLRWYGLAYAMGFLLGWWWLRWMSRRGMTPLSEQRISDAMLILVLGVVLGGRLGYVLFYSPKLLYTFTSSPPWWGVLQLNKGGMASHGGMIGVIIATWFIAKGFGPSPRGLPEHAALAQPTLDKAAATKQVAWMHVLDLTAVACTIGLMLGRIANFINGELLGKIVAMPGEPGPWWAVKFPQERDFDEPLKTIGNAPDLTQDQLAAFTKLLDAYRTSPQEPDGLVYERIVHLLQAGGAKGALVAKELAPLISSRYPSQLMQAATDGLILGTALWLIWYRPRKPGVIGCWFMVLYGVLRISTEFVRLPDSQLVWLKHDTGLSMGQWLSVVMVLVGIAGLVFFSRRDVPKMGGWGKRAA